MSDHFRAFQNSFRNISYHGDISDRLESHFIKVDRIYQSTGGHVKSFDIPFDCNSYNFEQGSRSWSSYKSGHSVKDARHRTPYY